MADLRFEELPLDLAFTDARGDGRRRLALFGDPEDPFTRELVRDHLAGITDVTVYTLLLPLEIYPDADRTTRLIWGSPDRTGAWYDWMTGGARPPGPPDPHTPIARLRLAAEEIGVDATPTLVFADGTMIAGATPAAEIERLLASA
ncbi:MULTISPECIES: DsbC family protein [Thermomonosporaceae]|uniref:DsbC family protein n=1 Tax=Thermomonosporaceae TaxID=2012 RepID=UPI00255B1850|nr:MULTISPECIES: DsbC family protein [Thermomonosporaceae]MDL4777175.1 DsbC family protein [Actinomadura xylanilytica]